MNHQDRSGPYHLAGWVLFLVCALLFFYAAVRDRDLTLAIASLVFLGGCVVFLIPLFFHRPGKGDRKIIDEDHPREKNV